VEVIMIDINDFLAVLVNESVRNGPPNTFHFLKVNRALVISVMQLSRTNKWVVPRRINII
jgi:hypothetical protein